MKLELNCTNRADVFTTHWPHFYNNAIIYAAFIKGTKWMYFPQFYISMWAQIPRRHQRGLWQPFRNEGCFFNFSQFTRTSSVRTSSIYLKSASLVLNICFQKGDAAKLNIDISVIKILWGNGGFVIGTCLLHHSTLNLPFLARAHLTIELSVICMMYGNEIWVMTAGSLKHLEKNIHILFSIYINVPCQRSIIGTINYSLMLNICTSKFNIRFIIWLRHGT